MSRRMRSRKPSGIVSSCENPRDSGTGFGLSWAGGTAYIMKRGRM
jgi:hypothetical protein